jgi:enoyl-CoA hydratase
MRLALTGEKLDAVTAAGWGRVAECVEAEQFPARGEAVLAALGSGATLALGQTKLAVNAASVDVEAALAREEAGQIALMDTDDYREGVAAFLAKRPADFTGR